MTAPIAGTSLTNPIQNQDCTPISKGALNVTRNNKNKIHPSSNSKGEINTSSHPADFKHSKIKV